MVISNSNVGIGMSNPQFLLDVSGGRSQFTATTTAPVAIGTSTSLNALVLQTTARRWGIQMGNTESGANAGADFFLNRSDDAGTQVAPPALVVKRSNGYVGLGTTAPTNFLHIQKGNYSVPANNTDGTTFGINFGSSNYADQAKILGVDRTNAGGVWGGELVMYTSYNGAASTEKVRINAVGNVGISATHPRSGFQSNAQTIGIPALDVSGQVYGRLPVFMVTGTSVDISANYAAYANSYFYITNSGFTTISNPATTSTAQGGTFFQFKNATSSYLSITVASSVSITSPVVIPPSNAITLVVSPSNANTFLLF
jgi:hypothetical protein